jgi:cytochrome c biogenesis factor
MIGAARGNQAWMDLARPAAVTQLFLVVFAFGAMVQAYVTSDFSLVNVVANSHSAKPLLYKITGVWGNHEGSMLLWILILALFGAAVIRVLYVNAPDLSVSAQVQRYTRQGGGLYRFESLEDGFTSEIELDEQGLVRVYPGLFERVL